MVDRRIIEHEVGIAIHQILLDVSVALALLHQLKHLVTQIAREVGVGVGEVFILANEAAQFAGEVLEAQFFSVVAKGERIDRLRCGDAHKGDQHKQNGSAQSLHHYGASFCNASITGFNCCAITSGVNGPMRL